MSDVSTELKNIGFAPTGAILTDVNVNEFLLQTEARVIGYVAKKYVVPIDAVVSPQSFELVKLMCIKLTAGRVDSILRRDSVAAINLDEKNRITNILNEGIKLLNDLMNDEMILVDAVRLRLLNAYVGFSQADADAVSNPYAVAGNFTNILSISPVPGGNPQTGPTLRKGIMQW